MLTVGTSVVALSAMTAGPALAHYCFKEGWNERAAQGAGSSQAWYTLADWEADFAMVRSDPDVTQACLDAIEDAEAYFAGFDENTLFMGPGLLAKGRIEQGKGATPSGIDHLSFEALMPLFTNCQPPS